MGDVKPTPGPWATGVGGLGSKEHVYTADGETMIADCCRGESRATGRANARLIAAAPQYAAALCEIGVGPFRREWLDEAEALWAARETKGNPDVWVVRCRELLRCMMNAHAVAGTDPADPEAGPVVATG